MVGTRGDRNVDGTRWLPWTEGEIEEVRGGDSPYDIDVVLVATWDAAEGQRSQSVPWCVPHARVASNGQLCPRTSSTNPCRVVESVVVIPAEAADE